MKIGSRVTFTDPEKIEDFDPDEGPFTVEHGDRGKVVFINPTGSYMVEFDKPLLVEVEPDQVTTFMALA